MTTIAIDNHMIAADSLATRADERRDMVNKIRRERFTMNGKEESILYAMVGCQAIFDVMIKWHMDGADPAKLPPMKDLRWGMIVCVRGQEPVMFTCDCAYPEPVDLPNAQGSGREYATALLDVGLSPIEAVLGGIKRDVYSGGPVLAYSLATHERITTVDAQGAFVARPAHQHMEAAE